MFGSLTASFLALFSSMAFAQGKISGYMIGDYYRILAHNNADIKNQNGFWLRRIYFTYDFKISDTWSTRFRIELNSPGDFKTKDTIKPFVKDAYLAWTKGTHSILLGLSPSPAFDYIESIWGYRSVEKTPLDLFKLADSRDIGIAFKGSFDEKKNFSYHIQIGNGEGTKSEINKEKKFMGAFLFKIANNFSFEAYGDSAQGASNSESWTYQGFLGWKRDKARAGIQYSHQDQKKGTSPKLRLDVFSLFGIKDLSEKTSLVLRYDRMADALPGASSISYVPMNSDAPFSLFIAGVDVRPFKGVSFIPNVMWVVYDKSELTGIRPDSDVHLKMTFFASF